MYQRPRLAFACLASLALACRPSRPDPAGRVPLDETRYAPLIVKALYRDGVAGTTLSALAETEKPIDGDNWFWTDDNAKALEALTLPKIFPHHLTEVGQMVKFIIANSPPPFVFRRRADDRALLKSASPEDFHLATGLMDFRGNLREGTVWQGYRFHAGRQLTASAYGGDPVRYSLNGKTYTTPIKGPSAIDVRQEAQATLLTHRSELRAAGKLAGNVSYTYRVQLNKPYVTLDLDVAAAPGVTLKNVQASTTLDAPGGNSPVKYSKFAAYLGSERLRTAAAKRTHEPRVLNAGPAQWWSINQNGNLGDSLAAATIIGSPERLQSIDSTQEHGGLFHHIASTYDLGTIEGGQSVRVSERKVLLAGGLYNSMALYDRVFTRLDEYPGLDLSISYDIGAELNGVASAYLADARRLQTQPNAAPVAYEAATRAWFDAIVEGYIAHFHVKVDQAYPFIYTRGHAFVLLALDTMYVATKDPRYLTQLRELADILMEFRVRSGPLADSLKCSVTNLFLDCHAAAMIALGRAAIATGDRKYAEAAYKALSSYQIDDEAATGNQIFVNITPDLKNTDSIYWIFKAGLLLRSLESLSLLDRRGLVHLGRKDLDKISGLRRRALQYIEQTIHVRGDSLELLTCHRAGETNSETQAWALLGLYPIERERTENR